MAEVEGPRLSIHQPRPSLYVRAVIHHLGRGSRGLCPMVENEGGRTHRRPVIRSTSSKPWPAPDRSTSSHNVERHLYKLLQPRRFLRSDNGASEQDSSSMLQIATPDTEFTHRLATAMSVSTFSRV